MPHLYIGPKLPKPGNKSNCHRGPTQRFTMFEHLEDPLLEHGHVGVGGNTVDGLKTFKQTTKGPSHGLSNPLSPPRHSKSVHFVITELAPAI
eukprot:2386323-Pyramimonas_sp.AAC.1